MTCAELYQLMANPDSISEKTIPDLQQIVIDFPYFHAARMLYLQKLAVAGDMRINVELRKMAIHIPDRIKLFMLIESNTSINQMPATTKQKESIRDAESTGQSVENVGNTHRENHLVFEPASLASVDYTRLLEANDQTTDSSPPKMQHQELIDWFIQNEHTRKQNRIMKEPEKMANDADEIIKTQDNWDNTLDNSYFTETLANIYIKQRQIGRAHV